MPEERLSSKRIYDGRIVKLRIDTIRKENGEETTREILEHDPVIAVVALADDETIIMVRQYRTPTGKALLEVPAGGVDPGETPEQAVIRELQEEIGYKPGRLERLGGAYSAPGFTDEYLDFFLATDLTPSRLFAEDTDEIEVVTVPLKDIPALAKSGEIEDAKTLAALYLYRESRR